jgi:hypothetical protein
VIRAAALACVLALIAGRVEAQTPAALVAAGVRAYQDLDFDQAAGYLGRALAAGDRALSLDERTQALAYLGAVQVFRDRGDSAAAVFGRLVRLRPRYRIDALIFPPEVTSVFDRVRRSVRAVAVVYPDSAVFRAGQPGFPIDLFPSVFQDARVQILNPDGSAARTVYGGPVGDSLRVEWDGRTTAGDPVPAGRYFLDVASLDSTGGPLRIVRVPLEIGLTIGDTLPDPAPPADSVLLPERATSGPALQSLLGGLVLGTAVATLPGAVAQGGDLWSARFAVGGAIGLAGVTGFFLRRPGRPLPDNVAANDRLRAEWQRQRAAVAQQNQALKERATVRVRAGTPQVIEREGG